MIKTSSTIITSDLSFIVVSNGVVTEVSQFFLNMTEYQIEDFLNKSIAEIFKTLMVGPDIDAEDIDDKADYFLFTKSFEARFVGIEVIKNSKGKLYIFKEKPNSRLDAKFPYVEKLCSDNYSGIAIFSMPDIILLKANEMYINFFEAPYNRKENCIGKSVREFVTGFMGSTSEKIWKTVLATGETYSIDEYAYDRFERGVTYWRGTITPVFENGKPKYCIEVTTEITEQVLYRKKVEEQARVIEQQKEELEAVIENMLDACLVYDKNGNVKLMNAEARKLYPESNVHKEIGRGHSELEFFDMDNNPIPKEDLPTKRSLKGEKINNEVIVSKKLDEVVYTETNCSPIYDKNKNLISIVTTHRDITEFMKNQLEIELQSQRLIKAEKEKNEALEKTIEMKDEFLSLISHELRTPLNVINTAIQAMQFMCKDELSDKTKGYIKIIKQNMYRQLRLVNNLLDITRADSGRSKVYKKNIDIVLLTKAITESVHTYAFQKGISVKLVSSFKEKVIGIDDEKYERILLNLLSNAIKFTPEGELITVKMRNMKNNICIEVIDRGIGIPEDKTGIIFEKFGQVESLLSRQAEGAGIGLSLVKRFVEALGGSISVKSQIGKGSTFTVLLPDEKVIEEHSDKPMVDLMNNRLIQVTNVEFSDIYL